MERKQLAMFVLMVLVTAGLSQGNLVAHWNFNETTGNTVLNDVVGTADGTFTNGSGGIFVPSTAGVTGTGLGNALDKSTTTEYIEFGDLGVLDFGTGDFTITGWFKRPLTPTTQSIYYEILHNAVHDAGGVDLMLVKGNVSSRGKLMFEVKGPAANLTILSDVRLDNDQWHWYAAMVESGVMSLYVDGIKQAGTATYLAGTTATAPAGNAARMARNYPGQLDEMCIYDTALSTTLNGNTLVGGELYNVWQIPEPATLTLLVMGFGMVCFKRK